MDIDGFSILTRVGKFPAQPVQLVAGLRSWLMGYGEEFPPKTKRLPINLVLTFASTLVNQVISSGNRDGLNTTFDMLKGLGFLAQPQVVTTFATNYPQFFEASFDGTPAETARGARPHRAGPGIPAAVRRECRVVRGDGGGRRARLPLRVSGPAGRAFAPLASARRSARSSSRRPSINCASRRSRPRATPPASATANSTPGWLPCAASSPNVPRNIPSKTPPRT